MEMGIASDLDPRAFRRALGRLGRGSAIITAEAADGRAVGLTMSWFNSVSIDPPLILFSIDRRSFSLNAMIEARGYAVNILGRDQQHLSNKFAKALDDKWTALEQTLRLEPAPLIARALTHFQPAPYAPYHAVDQLIFFGRVLRFTP